MSSEYKPPYIYSATISHVHDGDTFNVTIDLGCGVSVKQTIRVFGVNCPELKSGDEGESAKEFTRDWASKFNSVVICTRRDKREKYGRLLGTIFGFDGEHWRCLNTEITARHGVEYMTRGDLAAICESDLSRIQSGQLK